ncbi:hypothetical protein D2V93_06925 [Flagellimonas taeanensis]|uniref:RHS repeat domain-containing protein n=1 Tax=Flavobacteriaceae TaxID=49546 RepID=UPI000E67A8EB|nr:MULTISPECIES: RHS repeat domain-containing protein [Allomuricauda]MDC6384606.1 YD repeat-containing protein [Muricauda sp. SK9]RIV51631.1 hypothetical protein D2V93_06925 [Allomuricauda taeanensis]
MKKFIFCLLSASPVFCQELPDVIPPSPRATEMVKYIDYPANLSSGLPTVNVPIYTISARSLEVPISLSYHASGLRPNEAESGVVGLGWQLNAFGSVNRSINKREDYGLSVPLTDTIISTNTNLLVEDEAVFLLDNLANREADASPDIFSYVFPNGDGGKFVYDENSNPVQLPYKAKRILDDPSLKDYYDILDENGNLYRFGKSLSTGQTVHEEFRQVSGYDVSDGVTSWLLTEMISANKKDTVYFEYENVLNSGTLPPSNPNRHTLIKYSPSFSRSMREQVGSGAGSGTNFSTPPSESRTSIITTYTEKRITKIKFKNGEVHFVYSGDIYPDHLLDRIEVYDNHTTDPIKTIRLKQTKYHSNPNKLNWYKLDELEFYDANDAKVNEYGFHYNTGISFPDEDVFLSEPTRYTLAIDFWGYYNGANNNQDLLTDEFEWEPKFVNLFGSANRSPSPSYTQAGILTKIIFPTGGERSFVYEGNNFSAGINGYVGGVRIKSITNTTDGITTKRTFSYQGSARQVIREYFINHSMTFHAANGSTDYLTNDFSVSSNPKASLFINGRPMLYTKVTEYDGDENTNNGWIEHKFDTSFLGVSPISTYTNATLPDSPWNFSSFYIPFPKYYDNVVFGDTYEKETLVLNNQGDTTQVVKRYYSNDVVQTIKGFDASNLINYFPGHSYRKAGAFQFHNYDIRQLEQKLDSTETVNYQGNDEVFEKVEYVYNDKLFPTHKKVMNSSGAISNFQYGYPMDFSTQSPYNTMVTRNIIAPVIEEVLDVDSQVLSTSKKLTSYKDWGNFIIAPDTVKTAKGPATLENRVIYRDYDSMGNPEEVSLVDGPHVFFIWGYGGQYPLAKLENFESAQITGTIQGLINTAISASEQDSDRTRNYIGNEGALRQAMDNLRNALPNGSMMTSYTYDPTVGITSVTNPRGHTTYFDYDDFGRLEEERDKDGNLLRDYDYHFKGQTN